MTKTEEVLARRARYDRIERVVDKLDRTIGVKILKPSQQVMVQEFAPGLLGTTTTTDDDPDSPTFGKSFEVPRISPLIMAASVVEVDGKHYTFPKNRAELNAVLDMLDGEGLAAVAEALSRLNAEAADRAEGGPDAAKNSVATPPSDKPAGS